MYKDVQMRGKTPGGRCVGGWSSGTLGTSGTPLLAAKQRRQYFEVMESSRFSAGFTLKLHGLAPRFSPSTATSK